MKVGAATEKDLPGILSLQKRNLPESLNEKELLNDGFLTVVHDLEILRSMNDIYPHSVVKVKDSVIGYALAMDKSFANKIPILTPMFGRINDRLLSGDPALPLDYIVMGQVCIEKEFRGQGLFSLLYHNLKERLSNDFRQIITEVDMRNKRSLNAHFKVGFETLEVYEKNGKTWNLISWTWDV